MDCMKVDELNELTVGRQNLNEDTGLRTTLHEDVETFGLDPDVYLSVIEAELGKAGVVNRNRRIYKVSEFVAQNEALAARLDSDFVDGELGHPDGGPTFEVPARLIKVTVEGDEKTASARGSFAILNTSTGRDVLTLFRAGMEIGTSSRGSGMVEEVVLEEGGDYAEANPDYIGQPVYLVSDFALNTYDLVRVPSAGTRLTIEMGSSEPQKECVEMADSQVEIEVVEAGPVGEEAVEATVESVVENTDPLDQLNESQKAVLLKIVEAVSVEDAPSDNRLAKEVSALREQMEVDRHRSVVNEAEYVSLREEVQALRQERETRKLRDAVSAAIEECVEDRRFGGLVRSELHALVEGGTLSTVDAVAPRAERLFTMIEQSHTPIVEPVAQDPADLADDVAESVEVDVSETAPTLPVDIHEQLVRILQRDRA